MARSSSSRPRPHQQNARSLAQPRPLCPAADQPLPAVELRSPTRHPLVYRKRLLRVDHSAKPGDLVAVYAPPWGEESREPILVGYGLYNPRSEIALRVVRFSPELPDEAFWRGIVADAVRLRRELLQLEGVTDAYRVIHGEGDALPGLVVDRYGDVLSAEVFSLGMYQRCGPLLELLAEQLGTRHTLIQTAPHVLAHEGFDEPPRGSEGLPGSVTIQEFGTRFRVHFAEGHKTGFFCDQRDNRRQLASFCAGRTVLDLCCYTGGFAVQAKKLGQAAEVTGVDLDQQPLALARENANLNQVRIKFVEADIFPYMRDMLRCGRQYDVVVLDPPKLIRSRAEIDEGTRKHFDMNRLAMQLVRPGGLLLSCTCAGLLPQEEFVRLLYAAARQAGPVDESSGSRRSASRPLRVLAKTGAAADHPIAANCPETEYLSAVWMALN